MSYLFYLLLRFFLKSVELLIMILFPKIREGFPSINLSGTETIRSVHVRFVELKTDYDCAVAFHEYQYKKHSIWYIST